MADPLTAADEVVAAAQGWCLVTVFDTRGYAAIAVVPSPTSPHKTPFDAQTFVWDQAKKGDGVCQRALRIVAASEISGKSTTKKKAKR